MFLLPLVGRLLFLFENAEHSGKWSCAGGFTVKAAFVDPVCSHGRAISASRRTRKSPPRASLHSLSTRARVSTCDVSSSCLARLAGSGGARARQLRNAASAQISAAAAAYAASDRAH